MVAGREEEVTLFVCTVRTSEGTAGVTADTTEGVTATAAMRVGALDIPTVPLLGVELEKWAGKDWTC